jgi:hypothetical protein
VNWNFSLIIIVELAALGAAVLAAPKARIGRLGPASCNVTTAPSVTSEAKATAEAILILKRRH